MRSVARMFDVTMHPGFIANANPTVITNGRPTAALLDPCTCGLHGMASIVGGNASVLVGGKPIARILDPVACGAPSGFQMQVVKPTVEKINEPGPRGGKTGWKGHDGKVHIESQTPDGERKVVVDIEKGYWEKSFEGADVGGQGKAEAGTGKMTIRSEDNGDVYSEAREIEIKGKSIEGDADAWMGRKGSRFGFGTQGKAGVSGGSIKETTERKVEILGMEVKLRTSTSVDVGEGVGAGGQGYYDSDKKRVVLGGFAPVMDGVEGGAEISIGEVYPETDKLPNFILTGSPDVFTG